MLDCVVLARDMSMYFHRIARSAWDLPRRGRAAGFSGTDAHVVVPLQARHAVTAGSALAVLAATDGAMLQRFKCAR